MKRQVLWQTLCIALIFLMAGWVGGCKSKNKTQFQTRQMYITIQTAPEAATVTQHLPMGGGKVTLGTTPMKNIPVWVLSSFEGRGVGSKPPMGIMAQLGSVDLTIEKRGYQPLRVLLAAGLKDNPVVHSLTLQPEAEEDRTQELSGEEKDAAP